jgi:50S ribosomal subunit-associated GTPase HflX
VKWFYIIRRRKVPFSRKIMEEKKISKSALARSLGVSRSSLYYVPIQPIKDDDIRKKMEGVSDPILIVDAHLSPGQTRNLENALKMPSLDRRKM